MSALSIQPPFPIFTDTDGTPLEDGYIYIGTANQPPFSNPITVYTNAALTSTIAQPIRTLAGYPAVSGSPGRLYVNSDYSIQVQNKNGSVVYNAPAATERLSGVVIEIDSTDVSFIQAGTGAVTRTAQSKMRDVVSVLDFGADPSGVLDSAAAIQSALTAASHVTVPPGTYRCDSMIELNANKVLQLMGGATLKRMSANSASDDPVIWMKGSNASLFGAGQSNSFIVSENRAPKGVVRLGHKDMTESHGNVLYCTLKDLTISGAIYYGQTTGSPDVALNMVNPQFNGLASYFHNITGLKVQAANYGIWMQGWANGNTISHIQGYVIGNTSMVASLGDAFIYIDGALDNAISDCFFHFSPDTTGLKVTLNNNTGNGGIIHTPYANSCKGLVFEQGGANAFGCKISSGSGSYYEVKDNCPAGNQVFATFFDNNILFDINSANSKWSATQVQRNNSASAGAPSIIGYERYLTYSGMAENTTYKVVDVPIGTQAGATIEVDFFAIGSSGIAYQGGGKVVYELSRTSAGVLTGSGILSRYSGGIKPCNLIIAGGVATLVFKVDNNGTGVNLFTLGVDIKVTTLGAYSGAPTFYTSTTTSGAPGTPLANNI